MELIVVSLSRQRTREHRPAVALVKLLPRARAIENMTQDAWEPQPEHDNGLIVGDNRASFAKGQIPRKTAAPSTAPATGVESTLGVQHEEVYQILQPILGGGRLDPFVQWPVHITKRMQNLLDHSAFVA
jgi:hypothetical protein